MTYEIPTGRGGVPLADPDEILRHIADYPEIWAHEGDPGNRELIDDLLDMKLECREKATQA